MSEGFITRRGGGSELSFDVVGGTTQPTGKANRIWVNTSDTITSWIFHPTQPTAIEGRVWFKTDTVSDTAFNAIKKNSIWVYPIGCKQVISGAWVDKPAKTYQNGAWADWRKYLFRSGSGLQAGVSLTFVDTYPQHTVNSEKINWSNSLGNGNVFYFSPAIVMAEYSQLHFDLKCTAQYSAENKISVGASPSVPVLNTSVPFDAFVGGIYNTTRQTFSVDVTSIQGAKYLVVDAYAVLGELYNVWLD